VRNSKSIQQILTSPEGQKLLSYISPIYDDAYRGLWVLQSQGQQLDDLLNWANMVKEQIMPQTAQTSSTEGLDYWENEYGIYTDKTKTIKQRRDVLLAKIRTRGAMNPYKLAQIASAACGVSCRIVENTAKNTFDIYVTALNETGINTVALNTAVNKAKLSHLIFRIKYEQGVETSLYPAIFMYQSQKFTIGQVN